MNLRPLAAAVCLGVAGCSGGSRIAPPVAEPPPATRVVTRGAREISDPSLLWLAERQREDGSWSAADASRGAPTDDVCATALALHAFLGQGFTHRNEGWSGHAVGDGLRWLKKQQGEDGRFGPAGERQALRRDGLATCALLSVYGLTGSALWSQAAQRGLDALASSRAGWIPNSFPASDDALEAYAWAVGAFTTAGAIVRYQEQRSQAATLHPDAAALSEARLRFVALRDEGAVTTPMAMAARAHLTSALGSGPKDLELLRTDLAALAALPRSEAGSEGDLPARTVAFATMASQVRGLGPTYALWATRAREWVASARSDGQPGSLLTPRGSRWVWTGAVEATAYGVLAEPPFCSAYLPAFPGTEEPQSGVK